MPDLFVSALVFGTPLILGFLTGFLVVRANYVLIIFLGKVFSSGTAGWRYAATGMLAAIIVFLAVTLGVPDLTPAERLVVTGLFVASYSGGVLAAREETSPQEIRKITGAVFETSYPATSGSPGTVEASATKTAGRILETMPTSARAAIELLLAVFDSRTLVLLVSFRTGSLRAGRFVNLPTARRREYLEAWRTDPRLAYGAHALQILSSYAYYVQEEAGRRVGYGGTLLRDSYLE